MNDTDLGAIHGEWGVEAQFLEGADFVRSQRFEDVHVGDQMLKARDLAIAWATKERAVIEVYIGDE